MTKDVCTIMSCITLKDAAGGKQCGTKVLLHAFPTG